MFLQRKDVQITNMAVWVPSQSQRANSEWITLPLLCTNRDYSINATPLT